MLKAPNVPEVIYKDISIKVNKQTYLVEAPAYYINVMNIPATEVVSNGMDANNRMLKYGIGGRTVFFNTPYIPAYEPEEHEKAMTRLSIPQMVELYNNGVSFVLRNKNESIDLINTIDEYLDTMQKYTDFGNQALNLFLHDLSKFQQAAEHASYGLQIKANPQAVKPKADINSILKMFSF